MQCGLTDEIEICPEHGLDLVQSLLRRSKESGRLEKPLNKASTPYTEKSVERRRESSAKNRLPKREKMRAQYKNAGKDLIR